MVTKDWKICSLELVKEKRKFPPKFLPNFSRTETVKEREIMSQLANENVKTKLRLQATR